MPNLLESWRSLKRNGYLRGDRKILLSVFRLPGVSVHSSALANCGWPAVPSIRPQYSDRYERIGKAASAAVAAARGDGGGEAAAAMEALEALADELNDWVENGFSGRANRVLGKLPIEVRSRVCECSECGRIHVDGEDYGEFGTICENCVDLFSECECCGERCRAGGMMDDPEGRRLCEGCFNESFCSCVSCGEAFLSDDCYAAAGGMICPDCSERWYLWESDGLYHSRDADPLKVRFPNQGPDESESAAHKWLVDRAALGVVPGELVSGYLPCDKIGDIFRVLLVETGLGYGSSDYVDGKCGPEVLWKWVESQNVEGLGIPWVIKAGKFPRRVAKWFKDRLGRKLSTDVLGRIGDICGAFCPAPVRFRWEVKRPPFDWERGDFGDPSSCYWSCHTYARKQLETQHNAFALRFYDSAEGGTGRGRCWCVVNRGVAMLFNGYGPHTLLTMARVLAECAGWPSPKKISPFVNHGTGGGWLYLNSCVAHGVAPKGVEVPESFDFQWKDQRGL
jgi:hypothetical protein